MQRKQFLRYLGATLGIAAMSPALTGCGGGDAAPISGGTGTGGTLSQDEIDGLMFMREEEKLAHDVYVALFNLWGNQVFANIADSETSHTEAIRQLILAHGLDDPAATTAVGEFVDAELQTLYNDLVAMGQPSLIDALKVGCLIEEKDIVDINEKKSLLMDEPDIVLVYDNLLCGSRNHLRAFNRTLVNQGGTYTPQYLTQEAWDLIANSANETCSG